MQYTSRDLRAADMLAMIFVVVGLVFAVFGGAEFAGEVIDNARTDNAAVAPATSAEPVVDKAAETKSKKASKAARLPPGVGIGVTGLVLLLLGTATNLKVRELKRNGGREPADAPAS